MKTKLQAILCATLLLSVGAGGQDTSSLGPPQAPTLRLVREGVAPIAAPVGTTLVWSPVQLEGDAPDALRKAITDRGLRADGDVFALIYEHNPALENLNELRSGAVVILPEIQGPETLVALRAQGYVATFDLFSEARAALEKAVLQVDLRDRGLRSPGALKGPPANVVAMVRSSREIAESARKLAAASKNKTAALGQAQVERATRQLVLAASVQEGAFRNKSVSAALRQLRLELRETLAGFDGSNRGEAEVPRAPESWPLEVRLKIGDKDNVEGYEIRFCSAGEFRAFKGKEYEKITGHTPKATREFPFGKFTFWAVKADDTVEKRTGLREDVSIVRPVGGERPLVVPLVATVAGRGAGRP